MPAYNLKAAYQGMTWFIEMVQSVLANRSLSLFTIGPPPAVNKPQRKES